MTQTPFSELNLTPKVERAIAEMGFDIATPVQSEAIPLIRTGVDVIARSQTGTGKTIAFAIPAIEKVDTHEEKSSIQVLVICPTRELAQQAAEEIRKVARFKTGIHPVEVYGGAAIDKQCIRLRRANIVIGTPGRIMDHMRRKSIKLNNLKMIVLDEADEMLNMGFKEDIETILTDAPEDRQTVLFSATMPPAILKLTQQFQKDPQLIEINKDQVTIIDIDQSYVDVPHDRKKDALVSLLKFHKPNRAIIFSNTKKMVDDLTQLLRSKRLSVECIHSDINQSQRTSVMQDFKNGKTTILIATDIAARGIDVSDVDFVINYDVPANSEYYVHRIGRTGRAGKTGQAITLCSGRQEVAAMRHFAIEAKSEIAKRELPTKENIQKMTSAKQLLTMEAVLNGQLQPLFTEFADQLAAQGFSYQSIAAAAMQLHFANETAADAAIADIPRVERQESGSYPKARKKSDSFQSKPTGGYQAKPTGSFKAKPAGYETILLDVGSAHSVAVNHIVRAITERTNLTSRDIGKVDIFPEQTVVDVSSGRGREVIEAMEGYKISDKTVSTEMLADPIKKRKVSPSQGGYPQGGKAKSRSAFQQKSSYRSRG